MPTDGVDLGYAAADRSPVWSLHVLPLFESAALRSGGAGCGQRGLVWRPAGSSRLFVRRSRPDTASISTKFKAAEFRRRSASPAGGAETCSRDLHISSTQASAPHARITRRSHSRRCFTAAARSLQRRAGPLCSSGRALAFAQEQPRRLAVRALLLLVRCGSAHRLLKQAGAEPSETSDGAKCGRLTVELVAFAHRTRSFLNRWPRRTAVVRRVRVGGIGGGGPSLFVTGLVDRDGE